MNFDREKYDLILLGITKGGEWFRYYGGPEGIENDTWREGVCVPAVISPDRETHGIIEFGSDGVKATRHRRRLPRNATARTARTARYRACARWPAYPS